MPRRRPHKVPCKFEKAKRFKLVLRKLGRFNCAGQTWSDGVIEIDTRAHPTDLLDTCVHEPLHLLFPDMSEDEVVRAANTISKLLWKMGYRRVAVSQVKRRKRG